jgi:hypothetical protein
MHSCTVCGATVYWVSPLSQTDDQRRKDAAGVIVARDVLDHQDGRLCAGHGEVNPEVQDQVLLGLHQA